MSRRLDRKQDNVSKDDRKLGVGIDPNESDLLVNNPVTSYVSIQYLYQYMKLNYREDDNPETIEDNTMLKKYRNILRSKGVSGAQSEKLYVIASRVLKKVFNEDKMNDLREFHKIYREETLKYSRNPNSSLDNRVELNKPVNENKQENNLDEPKNDSARRRKYPSPFDIPNPNELPHPSPYNRK